MYFEIAIGYELLLYIAIDPLFFITVLYLLLLIILPGLRYSHSKYFARRKNLCILFMNSSFFATELYINRLYKIIFCALSFRKCGVENVKRAIRNEKDLTHKRSETPQTLRTFEFIITEDLFNADGH